METTSMFYLVPLTKTEVYLSFKAVHLFIIYLEQSDNRNCTDRNWTEAREMGWQSPRTKCSSLCAPITNVCKCTLPSLFLLGDECPFKGRLQLRFLHLEYAQG